jgi:sugar O-acyltransferase (sialic acid O-acetyltransferase NeuD family)
LIALKVAKNKQKIILVGCGEHARMIIDNLEEQGEFELFGLTTNLDTEVGTRVYGYPVLCKDEDVKELLTVEKDISGYFLGVGVKRMRIRYDVYTIFDRLLSPVNIIHPAAIISKHATLGRGILVEAFTKVANGAVIGNHVIVNSFSAVNHDQQIGENVLIAGNVSMAGKSIGAHSIIADGASIAFKKTVGRNCIIGDGAVITKDIPDNSIAYGSPAKVIRENAW